MLPIIADSSALAGFSDIPVKNPTTTNKNTMYKSMAGFKNAAQNERSVSGIFDNKEKIDEE